MSDVKTAVDFVLHQEDSKMSGVVTNNPRDTGGRTRFGIAEKFHPELTATGFFDDMSDADALCVADRIYEISYGNPLMLASINDQQTANALLSFAINEGVPTSIKVLQRALQGLDEGITVDGQFGPHTLALVNATPPATMLLLLGVYQRQHYTDIIAANPGDEVFRNGWMNRVTQNCQVA